MKLRVERSNVSGCVKIPGSKSHTIRALFIASLAAGRSVITNPLISDDALSAVAVCKAFGAGIQNTGDKFIVDGFNGKPSIPDDVINVGNSGTTLRIGLMTAGLIDGCTVFTGDYQIRRRPLEPLITAMNSLGANVFSVKGNSMVPVVIRGRLKGGKTKLDAMTSQFLTSILINAPLLENDTEILVTRLNEIPYVDMTMWWLENQGIEYSNDNYRTIIVRGNQSYKPFTAAIPGDFSSATFFMVQAAVSGGELTLKNLDITDPQGDKLVLDYLKAMGADISIGADCICVKGNNLKGIEIDMNATPDALPAMAVAGCFAEGETRLVNVPQARMKETDRIHVMFTELRKMGADIEELPDGLIVRHSRLNGTRVCGHDDHRIVMALAVAGMNSDAVTTIDGAEAMNVTFPDFVSLMSSCGGNLRMVEAN